MEHKKVCIFCGEAPGLFQCTTVVCGGTLQFCCRACEKELKQQSELEQCQNALRLGLAAEEEKLRARMEILLNAENHRPSCLRCGTKLTYRRVQHLDNTPLNDGILSDSFDVLPACCPNCGKMEFYDPDFINRNKYLVHLVELDTDE